MATYTTTGPVRGSCGHRHRTIRSAYSCLRRDQSGCREQGGYSDRIIVRTDGCAFDDAEQQSVEFWMDGKAGA